MNEYERMRLQKKILSGNDTPHSAIVRYYANEDLSLMDKYIKEKERLRHSYSNEPIVEVEKIDIDRIIERILLQSGLKKK